MRIPLPSRLPAWAIIAFFLFGFSAAAQAAGHYLKVDYPASTVPGELQIAVTYTIWIPDGVDHLRGIIVHQHGAGTTASKEGSTAAYDLHWQALAKKWDCALLGPSYHVLNEKIDLSPGGSELWFDPRKGSEKTFLKALGELAAQAKHPELQTVPWALWGHSGGGIWSDVMTTLHPDRVAAVWLRSGSAFMFRTKPEFPQAQVPPAAYHIPIMCNPGVKEKTRGPWIGTLATFTEYRAQGAPIGFAPDPRTGHDCGDSRYLAIPFFDACLAMRLPDKGSKDQTLKPVDESKVWLAPLHGEEAQPAAQFKGNPSEAVWLPNEGVARAWMDYAKTGAVGDATPPPAPFDVRVSADPQGGTQITWSAEADFESGIGGFIILRDGQELAKLPQHPIGKFGRPLFQSMTYHDTPDQPMPEMRYVDASAGPGEKHLYSIVVVNSVGLKSEPSAAVQTASVSRTRSYSFDRTISREVLENYLSRSISMEGLLNGRGDLDDNIRMLAATGAKYIGRSLCLWGNEANLLGNLQRAKEQVPKVLAADPQMILEACVFETVGTQVEQVPVPDWAFAAMGRPVEKRNFRYADMIYPEGQRRNWGPNASVPDVSRPETQLYFYFQAASYIDLGFEAIHFGQVEIMNRNDRSNAAWERLLTLVRAHAATHARHHMVLCNGHVPSGGLMREGRPLLDFHAFPLRVMEVSDRPQEAILKVGFSDGLYGRSKGGLTFSGWTCEHLPYLVELDNWGVSRTPGQAKAGGIWIWGYDEITWFAHQSREYRAQWLRYAWDWVRKTDPAGFLQMPGSRTLRSPLDGKRWYYANASSEKVPQGLGDEEAIGAIWAADTVRQSAAIPSPSGIDQASARPHANPVSAVAAGNTASAPPKLNPAAAIEQWGDPNTMTREQVIEKTMRPFTGESHPGVDVRTLTGKVMCGYQGWFAAQDDGVGRGWYHWLGRNGFQPGSCKIDLWPDVSELEADERYPTSFLHADGTPAEVFSSFNRKTVLRHFHWMKDSGIDGVFVQRFIGEVSNPKGLRQFNVVLDHCREGANLHGRTYAVMYDLSGLGSGQLQRVMDDWKLLIDRMQITRDPAYLHHGGKPVICVWGFGFNDRRRYTLDEGMQLVEFLKNDPRYGGCTVMLGVPTYWRTLERDCVKDPKMHDLILKADIVSPWTVGRYTTPRQAADYAQKTMKLDIQWCQDRGKQFMPVVFPGFSWHNMNANSPQNQIPRLKGKFLWSQFLAAREAGATMVYQAMFDEVDEGTAIFKCTNNPPVGASTFITLEGLPSDFYLKLVGNAARLIRGEARMTEEPPQ